MTSDSNETPLARDPRPRPADGLVLRSEELFGRSREIRIRHNGQEYRLQVTKNGKLILIK